MASRRTALLLSATRIYPRGIILDPVDPDPEEPVNPAVELPTPLRIVTISGDAQLGQYLAGSYMGGQTPGDQVRLANVNYTTARTFTVNGTQANPIVFMATTVLGAKVLGDIMWSVNGTDIYMHGIEFNGSQLRSTVSRISILRCKFHNCERSAIVFEGPQKGSRIGYCQITTKPYVFGVTPAPGKANRRGVDVLMENDADAPKEVYIFRTHFHDFGMKPLSDYDSGQNTCLRTAETSNDANISSKWVTEWCLFTNVNCSTPTADGLGIKDRVGTFEPKSSDNTFQYNTILNCPGLVQNRQGFGGRYISNWFENSGGLVFYSGEAGNSRGDPALPDYHLALGNFFRNCVAGLRIMAGQEATWTGTADKQTASVGSMLIGNDSNLYDIGEDYGDSGRFPARNTRIEACRKGTGATFGSGTLVTSTAQVTLDNQTGTTVSGTNTTGIAMPTQAPVKLTTAQVGPNAPWVEEA